VKKFILITSEYLFGLVTLLVTLVMILISLFVALFELPRYLRNKRM
jgi:hypothetical protein